MNVQDKILTALTPGTPFNIHNRTWRSINSLAAYAGLAPEQVLDILVGDLSTQVAAKPGKKGVMMVALKANAALPDEQPEPPMIKVAGGNAFNTKTIISTADSVGEPIADYVALETNIMAKLAKEPEGKFSVLDPDSGFTYSSPQPGSLMAEDDDEDFEDDEEEED